METVLIQTLSILLAAGAYFVLLYFLFRLFNPAPEKTEKQEEKDEQAAIREYRKKSIAITFRNTLICLLICGILIICVKSCSFGAGGGSSDASKEKCRNCGRTGKIVPGYGYCYDCFDGYLDWEKRNND